MKRFYEEDAAYFNRILIQEKEHAYTYLDWKHTADRLTKLVPERSVILLFCHNKGEMLLGLLSFLRNNYITIVMDADLAGKQIAHLMTLYQPAFLFLPSTQGEAYQSREKDAAIWSLGEYVLLRTDYPIRRGRDYGVRMLLSTSGSTGSPKYVKLTGRGMDHVAACTNQTLEASGKDVMITGLPMNFVYCLENIFRHVREGAKIIVTDTSMLKQEFWDLCKKYQPTFFYAVPYVYEAIFQLGIEDNLKQFHTLSIAGSKPGYSLLTRITDLVKEGHALFYEEYGQTECSGALTIDIKTKDGINMVSEKIGVPHPRCKVTILDGHGREIDETGREGAICYQGPNVCMGYAQSFEDLHAKDRQHEEIMTGDVGVREDNGYIRLVGRVKRFIKIYGKRYSLDYMETCLREALQEPEIVLVGRDDMLHAFCLKEEQVPLLKKQLRTYYKLSIRNFTVDTIVQIPQKPNGKIDYMQLMAIKEKVES